LTFQVAIFILPCYPERSTLRLEEEVMPRKLSLVIGCSAILVLPALDLGCATPATPAPKAQSTTSTASVSSTTAPPAQQFGTEAEARAMLERAIAALKENKQSALETFNKGESGFRDRDLYVFCANVSDSVLTAHPYLRGEHLQDIKGKKGYPLGKEIMENATEGEIKTVTYWWPRPGKTEPHEKNTFYTRVGDQDCGVGYYK
jgi:cache domain-containing protein